MSYRTAEPEYVLAAFYPLLKLDLEGPPETQPHSSAVSWQGT